MPAAWAAPVGIALSGYGLGSIDHVLTPENNQPIIGPLANENGLTPDAAYLTLGVFSGLAARGTSRIPTGPQSTVQAGSGIEANAAAGAARQSQAKAALERDYPAASVQSEQLLRTVDGMKAIDPLSGTGRRLDNVSRTANKAAQAAKERRIRDAGGVFVRDRTTGKLVEVPESRLDRRP